MKSRTVLSGLLLSGIVLLSSHAKADEAVCFVQPANSVPIPCNLDGNNNIIVATTDGSDASATSQLSGSIVSGGTFQQISATSLTRKSFEFQNNNSTDTCYIFFGTTAAANTAGITKALAVAAGFYYLRSAGAIPSDGIQLTCANTSDTFYATVQ